MKITNNKKSEIIFSIFLIQGIVGFVILTQNTFGDNISWEINKGIVIIYGIFNIVSIIGIRYIIELLDKDIKYQKLLIELQKSDEVVMLLRSHKHDFFNHLQVISGLAQLNKNDRIVEYIQNISKSINQSYEIANIEIPEIAIVLMQKLGEASNKGIKIETCIGSNCEKLKSSGVIYAQILFNLLDNAIYELEKLERCPKLLKVEVREEQGYIHFIIFNNLPIIPQKDIACLFKRGFSTKQGEHCGLGLWNVENLVNASKGTIKVVSSVDYGTEFKVSYKK